MKSGEGPESFSFLGRLARAENEMEIAEAAGQGVHERYVPLTELPDPAVLAAIVARNLRFMLSTKKRHGSVLVDYGLGDYDDPRYVSQDVDRLAGEIRATVAKYERRLEGPTVKAVARDARSRIAYDLTGTLAGQEQRFRIVFDTFLRGVTVEVG